MIVSNDMTHDSRVDRHARTLASIGHEVTVLSRASSREQSRHERAAGYTIVRYFESLISPRVLVQKESGPASAPRHWPLGAKTLAKCLNVTKRLSLLFAQRLWLYVVALRIRADICRCNDLDTLDIGALMKITGKKVVYDSHELYVEQIPPSALKALLTVSERLFLKLTDVVITVNPFIAASLLHTYQIKKPVRVVLNCPENADLPAVRFRGPSDLVVLLSKSRSGYSVEFGVFRN